MDVQGACLVASLPSTTAYGRRRLWIYAPTTIAVERIRLCGDSIESMSYPSTLGLERETMAPTKTGKASPGFSAEEKAAMRERTRELKAEAAKADGETEVLAAIAKMQEPDRTIAKRVHALIKAAAPGLAAKTWYGMPAYAKDGNVICFFKNAGKFNVRYQELGFSDKANLDDGAMWPDSYALLKLTATEEAKITALVKKAVS
jgi:uncharacterized protein YdhG (YjbR/CyaY superfamily)